VRCLWPLMHAALDADLPFLMPRWHGLPSRHAASSDPGSPLVLCVPHSQAATCVPAAIALATRTAGARRRLLANELYNERTTPAYIESVAERHDREVIGMSGTAGARNVATGQTARRCPLCGKPVTPDALGFLECSCGWDGADDPLLTARGLTRWPASAGTKTASQLMPTACGHADRQPASCHRRSTCAVRSVDRAQGRGIGGRHRGQAERAAALHVRAPTCRR
jgi:hypothetical protein